MYSQMKPQLQIFTLPFMFCSSDFQAGGAQFASTVHKPKIVSKDVFGDGEHVGNWRIRGCHRR